MQLTQRQFEVAQMLACGLSYKAVARELRLSVRTIEDCVQRAAERIGGDGRPRDRLIVFVLQPPDPDEDYEDAA